MNHVHDDVEEWKDILGWEDKYSVSSHGRVKSLPRKQGNKIIEERIMALHDDKGYLCVWLRKPGGIHQKMRVHRLVGVMFLSKPSQPYDEIVVNHKDHDRSHNHHSNLEWATYSENSQHYVEDDKIKAGQQKIMTAADIPF